MSFIAIKEYDFLEKIIQNVDLIKNEFEIALLECDYMQEILIDKVDLDHHSVYWVQDNGFNAEKIGYDLRAGKFGTLTLYKKGFPIKTYEVKKYFSKTLELIQEVPSVYWISFAKMNAGTKLLPHKHNRRHLVFHLLLNDLQNGACKIKCDSSEKEMKNKGDAVLFDYSKKHSSENCSSSDRINLVIDFNPF